MRLAVAFARQIATDELTSVDHYGAFAAGKARATYLESFEGTPAQMGFGRVIAAGFAQLIGGIVHGDPPEKADALRRCEEILDEYEGASIFHEDGIQGDPVSLDAKAKRVLDSWYAIRHHNPG